MPNDFLASLHSSVIGIVPEKVEASAVDEKLTAKTRRGGKEKREEREEREASREQDDDRHRTIGVSMSPKLKARAEARAEAVGLSFSRYVQWCIEAELDGATLESRFRAKSGMGESRAGENKPSESKPSEPKPSEAKPSEVGRGIKGLIQRAGLGGAS